MDREGKVNQLKSIIAGLESVVVAFSGGADSTLLLTVCRDVLGAERVLAATADSPSLPRKELAEAVVLADELGVKHAVVHTGELEDPDFASNPPDRCYHCKRGLFEELRALAQHHGYKHLVYGATAHDLGDHRPGMQAAEEAGAIAPLLLAGFTKDDVRGLSRQLGLRTWDKPSMACLSSRFPYGSRLTLEKLSRVEKAEDLLRSELGFRQVRVRDHAPIARIEIEPGEFSRMLEESVRRRITDRFKELGYTYITLDLDGFRSGSMNEPLRERTSEADLARTSSHAAAPPSELEGDGGDETGIPG